MILALRTVLALVLLGAALPADAALSILATTADWGALAAELGGERVNVYTATTAFQDVHRLEARPSLVARARTADLVVASGAELEVGWLPVLLQESGNGRIRQGMPGYFEAASLVSRLEVPTSADRALGDIHPQGNPHVQLDPRNIAVIGRALTARLVQLDPGGAQYFQARGADFQARWQAAIARWQLRAAPLKDMPVVVIHRDQAYLAHWLELRIVAAIEPKPGVPPSAGSLVQLVSVLTAAPPRMILRNAYNDAKAANWLSERIHVPVVLLPFSVGGTGKAKDLFGLFDDTIDRLLAAAR